jgi:hypothetical protein
VTDSPIDNVVSIPRQRTDVSGATDTLSWLVTDAAMQRISTERGLLHCRDNEYVHGLLANIRRGKTVSYIRAFKG